MIDNELKKKVESILFTSGKKLRLDDIAKLLGMREHEHLLIILKELQGEYESGDHAFTLLQDGESWKLSVRDRYAPVVSKMMIQTELTKTVMETLAVIAYKAPMLQSDLIKIRTNKAYDHLLELEKFGYIIRKKKGRTKEIGLAGKFFEYFDVPAERLKERFRSVEELETAVKQQEIKAAQIRKEIASTLSQTRINEEEHKQAVQQEIQLIEDHIENIPVIELIDNKGHVHPLVIVDEVESYKQEPLGTTQLKIFKEELAGLEVVQTTTKPEQGEPQFLGEMQVYERKVRKKKTVKQDQEAKTISPEFEESIESTTESTHPSITQEAPLLFGEKPSKEIAQIIERRANELMTKVESFEEEAINEKRVDKGISDKSAGE
ncbi:MAG: SMC-Scp complex subunit ScpB [Nanoarchaeota archaeon]